MSAVRTALVLGLLLLPLAAAPQAASSAAAGAVLRGTVVDPTGASVAHAQVTLIGADGVSHQTVSGDQGTFTLNRVPVGSDQLVVTAPGFAPFRQTVILVTVRPAPFQVKLKLASAQQQVSVAGNATNVSLQNADRAGAVILTGSALKSLSADPDQLATDLQSLAGPSIGGAGGAIYINGFTGGDLPPKADILSIKVNNDPFSPVYSRLGYGRIEIQTRPGSATLHGGFTYDGNRGGFNSVNPFLAAAGTAPAAYHSNIYSFNLGGPAGKTTSWFLTVQHRDLANIGLVNAQILGPGLTPQTYVATIGNPDHRTAITPEFDFQLTPKNILAVRYEFLSFGESGNHVGGTTLPTAANDHLTHRHNLQLADTQILSANVVNVTSYQYLHHWEHDTPLSTAPSLRVLGAFTGGGNPEGTYHNWETHDDLRDDLSVNHGPHQFMAGGETAYVGRKESNRTGYNGAFVFDSLADYQATQQGLQNGQTMAQIQAAGHGPSQFSLTTGNSLARIARLDASLYLQDSWQAFPHLNLTYGLRFESENMQHDHADWAPRVGFAWGIGRGLQPATVVRGGYGIFYDRLDDDQMIVAAHSLVGGQLQYLVSNPAFYPNLPAAPTLASLPASFPTTFTYAPNLQAPLNQTLSLSFERQVGRNATISLDFLHTYGTHLFVSNDVNAPLPGTYDPAVPGSGVRPYGNARGNINQYQSAGVFRQNQLTLNFKFHPAGVSLSGYYTFNDAHSDTAGADSFPTNPWNLMADYGRTGYDIRHRFYVSGSVSLPFGFNAYPFLVAQSGRPFSITLGQDLYGAGQQNARPAYATPSTPAADLAQTPYGNFNLAPNPAGAIIPPNTATGPASLAVNLRLTKSFTFAAGPGDRRYELDLGVSARNLLNTVNLGAPVGNLNSPRFAQSIALAGGEYSNGAANRRIDIVASFSF